MINLPGQDQADLPGARSPRSITENGLLNSYQRSQHIDPMMPYPHGVREGLVRMWMKALLGWVSTARLGSYGAESVASTNQFATYLNDLLHRQPPSARCRTPRSPLRRRGVLADPREDLGGRPSGSVVRGAITAEGSVQVRLGRHPCGQQRATLRAKSQQKLTVTSAAFTHGAGCPCVRDVIGCHRADFSPAHE